MGKVWNWVARNWVHVLDPNSDYYSFIEQKVDEEIERMEDTPVQYPHCDSRILHGPGECEFCDMYPSAQAIRQRDGIAFSGHKWSAAQPIPCPADVAVANGERGDYNQWEGNVASMKTSGKSTWVPEARCASTPPPMKWKAQQCDRLAGHEGEHWFEDGMTRNRWTKEHMKWCRLDTDHTGMCDPDLASHDGTRPEPGECGDVRPYGTPSGLRCQLDPGHEGQHEDTWVGGKYAWNDKASLAVLPSTGPTMHDVLEDWHINKCENDDSAEPTTCITYDKAHDVWCDLNPDHNPDWHTGTDGVRRYYWPVEDKYREVIDLAIEAAKYRVVGFKEDKLGRTVAAIIEADEAPETVRHYANDGDSTEVLKGPGIDYRDRCIEWGWTVDEFAKLPADALVDMWEESLTSPSVPAHGQTEGTNDSWWVYVSDEEVETLLDHVVRVAHSAARVVEKAQSFRTPEGRELAKDVWAWTAYFDDLKGRYT